MYEIVRRSNAPKVNTPGRSLELRQLKHFVALAESLNFRRAAERVHIAQPALSVSIRRLERDLGVQLFTRDRSGVQITDAGRAIFADVEKALQAAARIRVQARAAASGDVGTLRVAFVATATYKLLSYTLEELRRTHPGVRLELYERNTDAIVSGLENQRFDVAIVRFPMRTVPGSTLEIVEDDRYCVMLPLNHRLASRKRVKLKELETDPFIVPSATESPALHNLVLSACQNAGFMPVIARQEALQVQTVLTLVESGFGVALLPESLVSSVRRNISFLRLAEPGATIRTGLALLYPSESSENPLLRHFRTAVLSRGSTRRRV